MKNPLLLDRKMKSTKESIKTKSIILIIYSHRHVIYVQCRVWFTYNFPISELIYVRSNLICRKGGGSGKLAGKHYESSRFDNLLEALNLACPGPHSLIISKCDRFTDLRRYIQENHWPGQQFEHSNRKASVVLQVRTAKRKWKRNLCSQRHGNWKPCTVSPPVWRFCGDNLTVWLEKMIRFLFPTR